MNWEKSRSPARTTFKNPKISLLIGKNLEVQSKTNTQKIPVWNLWRNWKNLWSYLSFTVENKIGKKNMFSTGKNWNLNTLGILCWPRKGPEYLYQLFDVLPTQTTREVKALQVCKFTFNNDFMMNREPISLWSEITLGMYLSASGRPYF